MDRRKMLLLHQSVETAAVCEEVGVVSNHLVQGLGNAALRREVENQNDSEENYQ